MAHSHSGSRELKPMSTFLWTSSAKFVATVLPAVVGMLAVLPAALGEEAVVNVYNWSDYIAEDAIDQFEMETGIAVNYDVFDSNQVLEARLLAGGTGYDVVFPSAEVLERQIMAGVFMELDPTQLPNRRHLDPAVHQRLAAHDPGNRHAVTYMWGTTGIGYDRDAIASRMSNPPIDSWAMLFDTTVVSAFADCGVTLLDAPDEVFAAALSYLGRDPNSENMADLVAAEDAIAQIRPHIRYFHSSLIIGDLANGEICLAMGWSGDMLIARARAREAGTGRRIAYAIPKQGAALWFDVMAIPRDAPHPGNAHLFIDHLLRPEVSAAISNAVFFAGGNADAKPFLRDDVRTDESIYPPSHVMSRLFPAKAPPPEFDRARARAWTRIKTGQ